jgi:hypothetical protein
MLLQFCLFQCIFSFFCCPFFKKIKKKIKKKNEKILKKKNLKIKNKKNQETTTLKNVFHLKSQPVILLLNPKNEGNFDIIQSCNFDIIQNLKYQLNIF